jgi:hypothetical protein
MHSRKACIATLLAAVKHASNLTSHIVMHPFDFTVLAPLISTAKSIGSCALALRQKELRQLSFRLVEAAQMDLTTSEGVTELSDTMARVASIAETFGDLNAADSRPGAANAQIDKGDPLSSLTGTTWVVL